MGKYYKLILLKKHWICRDWICEQEKMNKRKSNFQINLQVKDAKSVDFVFVFLNNILH